MANYVNARIPHTIDIGLDFEVVLECYIVVVVDRKKSSMVTCQRRHGGALWVVSMSHMC